MLKKVIPAANYGQVAAWLVPVLGDELAGAPAGSAVDSRALALLEEVDPDLASDLTRGLWAAHWVLPLLALRLPPASRLSTQRRELALNRCVNPPLLLRPLRMPLRGIARALKLLVVFPYFTQDSAREAVGYVEMHLRPRARGLDLRLRHYPPPGVSAR